MLAVVDVGREIGLALVQRLREFRADGIGLRLELLEPGKFAALVELDRRQARVVVLGRLLLETRLDAQRHLDERVEASPLRGGAAAFRGSAIVPRMWSPSCARIRAVHFAPAVDRLQRRRVEGLVGRRVGERCAVGERGRHGVTFALEHGGAHQQRAEVAPVDGQDLTNRLEGAVEVVALAPDGGEVEPGRQVVLRHGDGLQQRGLGADQVARRHGAHGGLVAVGGVLQRTRPLGRACRIHAITPWQK